MARPRRLPGGFRNGRSSEARQSSSSSLPARRIRRCQRHAFSTRAAARRARIAALRRVQLHERGSGGGAIGADRAPRLVPAPPGFYPAARAAVRLSGVGWLSPVTTVTSAKTPTERQNRAHRQNRDRTPLHRRSGCRAARDECCSAERRKPPLRAVVVDTWAGLRRRADRVAAGRSTAARDRPVGAARRRSRSGVDSVPSRRWPS